MAPGASAPKARSRGGPGRTSAASASDRRDAEAQPPPTGRRWVLAAGGALVAAAAAAAAGAAPLPGRPVLREGLEPQVYSYRIVRTYDHDPEAFTQGLLWINGSLYESTGLYGKSGVREIRLTDDGRAEVVRQSRLGPKDFGEGLVHSGGQLLQLLWHQGEGVRYNIQAGESGKLERVKKRFRTPLSDGWGLETDGKSLLITDSGSDIIFVNPESFKLERRVTVQDAEEVVEMLNELEFIGKELWANVFGTECLARVDPASGVVTGWVVLAGLLDRRKYAAEAAAAGRAPPDVLNGIAWDPENRRLFVTGKLWPKLYEIEVLPKAVVSLEQARNLCIPRVNVFRQR